MDFRINRETIPVSEKVWEGVQEQSVELDYILPDYYPDIFRLVRCEVKPAVTDYSVNGDKLSYELVCDIRILYCSEGGKTLQCVSQKQNFSRTAELGKMCESPEVSISAKADHSNFRAVNKRRLDMRGAVSVRICVTGEKMQEAVSDAFGMNIQLRKTPVTFASQKLRAEKNLQLSEETELSPTQPPMSGIITYRCSISGKEVKVISGKLLAKGEVNVEMLYSCEKGGETSAEPLSLTVPYSQIVDIDGMDESYECTVNPEIISCDITPCADKSGENRIVKCSPEIRLVCKAVKKSSVMIVSDAFSTVYPCEISCSEIRAEQIPDVNSEKFRHSAVIASGDSVPSAVFGMWVVPRNINASVTEGGSGVTITGMLTYTTAGRDSSGMMIISDKDETFEKTLPFPDGLTGHSVSVNISSSDVTYKIGADGTLTAESQLQADISVSGSESVKAVTDITIDDSSKKQRDGDYAVKLYFGTQDEDIWDIAKRYSTREDAIIEENDLEGGKLETGAMLLIPIKE